MRFLVGIESPHAPDLIKISASFTMPGKESFNHHIWLQIWPRLSRIRRVRRERHRHGFTKFVVPSVSLRTPLILMMQMQTLLITFDWNGDLAIDHKPAKLNLGADKDTPKPTSPRPCAIVFSYYAGSHFF